MPLCKFGDPFCPCQDGDPCHYEGRNPMRPPTVITTIPTVKAHWDAWLDYSCQCGFPHPRPGKHGPPPTIMGIEGVGIVRYPRYPYVLGDFEPIPMAAASTKGMK